MQKMLNIWAGTLVLGMSCLLCSIVAAQQVPRNPAAKFEFSPRTLDDGSEAFDTLIRSEDGLFIYGCIRKPSGAGSFPGVILIHGGLGGSPGAARNAALKNTPANALVKHGYVVLGADYRAGDWIGEYRDIISAYEFFRRLPYVKADAIAIMGGSHGGKLTLEAVTHIHPQAAVPCAGLYDLARLYEHCRTSEFHQARATGRRPSPGQIFSKEIVAQLGGTPEQVPEKYRQYSGISRVSRIRTPLLVVHGKQDLSVPVSFGYDLAAALKEHGKTVETYYAEKGPHGFYWGRSAQGKFGAKYDPKENEVFLERMLAFLDKNLKKKQAAK